MWVEAGVVLVTEGLAVLVEGHGILWEQVCRQAETCTSRNMLRKVRLDKRLGKQHTSKTDSNIDGLNANAMEPK